MAVNIQRVNSRIFTIDSDPKAKGYRAIADGNNIAIVSDGASTPNITNGRHFSNFITRSADGTILFDGTSGATVTQLVDSINEIANFSGGSVSVIPDNLIFANAAARDAYFNPSRLDELTTGIEIILEDDGSGNRVFERWTGESNPSSYPAIPADFWFTEGTDVLTAIQVKTLNESNPNTNALTDDKLSILGLLTLDPNGDVRSSRTFIFPPGSVEIGDTVLSSGGRVVTVRSKTTGNRGSVVIQLYTATGFGHPTFPDPTQSATQFNIQTSDTSESSGLTETNVRQVVQNDVQFQKVQFMPNGALPDSFTFGIRLSPLGDFIYQETVLPTDLTDIGSGIYELDLIDNPSQFDSGNNAYISFEGIDLLGGNGFDGTDTIRFGDATKSNYFPWLRSVSIPIDRLRFASENFVNSHTNLFTDAERTKLNGIAENAEVNVQSDWNETDTNEDSYIANKPTLLTPRTDEEIQDIIGAMVTDNVETGIVVSYNDGLGKLNFVVTGNGGGTPPPAGADIIYYGLSATNNPATVDVGTLTNENDPTNPDMIQSGVATQGQYFIVLVPFNDDISTIFDTVLNQDVTNLFTMTSNVRTLNSEAYNSYVIGPLNAEFNETYILNF